MRGDDSLTACSMSDISDLLCKLPKEYSAEACFHELEFAEIKGEMCNRRHLLKVFLVSVQIDTKEKQ